MEITYKIAIFGTILLGIIHSAMTRKTYKKGDKNAYWFLSAGLVLIITGILNYINLKTQSSTSTELTFISNSLVLLFSIALAFRMKRPTMFLVTIFSLLLVICSLFILTK